MNQYDKKIFLYFTFGVLLLTNIAWTKWEVKTQKYCYTGIKYSIHKDNLKSFSGFYFPEIIYRPALLTGYKPIRKQIIRELDFIYQGKIFAWEKVFHNPIQCEYDSTFLYQRLFIKNISQIKSGTYRNWNWRK